MIRILQVVTHMNRGGLETMLMNYYRQMDCAQVQFDFLTHRNYDGDYGAEIRAMGGKIYHLPLLNPFSGSYKKSLENFFDNHPEYKIVHVHQDCLSSVILKVAKQHGVKGRIAHSHNANQDKGLKYLVKLFYRQFIPKYATHLLACGVDAGKWMYRGKPFTVLNNAIDAKKYLFDLQKKITERESLGLTQLDIVIGHVGRFSPQKNHLFLVDIFNEVQKRCQAKLLLVGDDTEENADKVKEKITVLGLQDKVIFTGVRSDVVDLLQAMDVFVLPSHYEGLPVTVVEAQANGLSCLISDKVPIECKMTELVEQIPLAAGAEAWADKVIEVAKTPRKNTYEEIKKAGYDIVVNARKLQEYYLKVYEN